MRSLTATTANGFAPFSSGRRSLRASSGKDSLRVVVGVRLFVHCVQRRSPKRHAAGEDSVPACHRPRHSFTEIACHQRVLLRARRPLFTTRSCSNVLSVFLLIAVVLALCYAVAANDRLSLSLASLPLTGLPQLLNKQLLIRGHRFLHSSSIAKVPSSLFLHRLSLRLFSRPRSAPLFAVADRPRPSHLRLSSALGDAAPSPSLSFLSSPFSAPHSPSAAAFMAGASDAERERKSCFLRALPALLLASSLPPDRTSPSSSSLRSTSCGKLEGCAVSPERLCGAKTPNWLESSLPFPFSSLLSASPLSYASGSDDPCTASADLARLCSGGEVQKPDEREDAEPAGREADSTRGEARGFSRGPSAECSGREQPVQAQTPEGERMRAERQPLTHSSTLHDGSPAPDRPLQERPRVPADRYDETGTVLRQVSSFSRRSCPPSALFSSSSLASPAASCFTPLFAPSTASPRGSPRAPSSFTARPACDRSWQAESETGDRRKRGRFEEQRMFKEDAYLPLFASASKKPEPSGDESDDECEVATGAGVGVHNLIRRTERADKDEEDEEERDAEARRDDGAAAPEAGEDETDRPLEPGDNEAKRDTDLSRKTQPQRTHEENQVHFDFQDIAASAACNIFIRTLLSRADALHIAARGQLVRSLLRLATASSAGAASRAPPAESAASCATAPSPAASVLQQAVEEDVFSALLPLLLANAERHALALAALRASSGQRRSPSLWRRWVWRHEDDSERGDLPVEARRRRAPGAAPAAASSAGLEALGGPEATDGEREGGMRGDAGERETAVGEEEEVDGEALLNELRTQHEEARRDALRLILLLLKNIPDALRQRPAQTQALTALLERIAEEGEIEKREEGHRRGDHPPGGAVVGDRPASPQAERPAERPTGNARMNAAVAQGGRNQELLSPPETARAGPTSRAVSASPAAASPSSPFSLSLPSSSPYDCLSTVEGSSSRYDYPSSGTQSPPSSPTSSVISGVGGARAWAAAPRLDEGENKPPSEGAGAQASKRDRHARSDAAGYAREIPESQAEEAEERRGEDKSAPEAAPSSGLATAPTRTPASPEEKKPGAAAAGERRSGAEENGEQATKEETARDIPPTSRRGELDNTQRPSGDTAGESALRAKDAAAKNTSGRDCQARENAADTRGDAAEASLDRNERPTQRAGEYDAAKAAREHTASEHAESERAVSGGCGRGEDGEEAHSRGSRVQQREEGRRRAGEAAREDEAKRLAAEILLLLASPPYAADLHAEDAPAHEQEGRIAAPREEAPRSLVSPTLAPCDEEGNETATQDERQTSVSEAPRSALSPPFPASAGSESPAERPAGDAERAPFRPSASPDSVASSGCFFSRLLSGLPERADAAARSREERAEEDKARGDAPGEAPPEQEGAAGAGTTFAAPSDAACSARALWVPVLLSANRASEQEALQASLAAAEPRILGALRARARVAPRRAREETHKQASDAGEGVGAEAWEKPAREGEERGGESGEIDKERTATQARRGGRPERRKAEDAPPSSGDEESGGRREEGSSKVLRSPEEPLAYRHAGPEAPAHAPAPPSLREEDAVAAQVDGLLQSRSFFVSETGVAEPWKREDFRETRKAGNANRPGTGDEEEWGLLGLYLPGVLDDAAAPSSSPSSASSSWSWSVPCEVVALFRGPGLARALAPRISPAFPLLASGDDSKPLSKKRERERARKRAEKLLRVAGVRALFAATQARHPEARARALEMLLRLLKSATQKAHAAEEFAQILGAFPLSTPVDSAPADRSVRQQEEDAQGPRGELEPKAGREGENHAGEGLANDEPHPPDEDPTQQRRRARRAVVDLIVSALLASVLERHARRQRPASSGASVSSAASASSAEAVAWGEKSEAAGLEMLYELCLLSAEWMNVLQTHTGVYVLLLALSKELDGEVKLHSAPSPAAAASASPLAFSAVPPLLRHARAPARVARRLRYVGILRTALGFAALSPAAAFPPACASLSSSALRERRRRRRGLRILAFDGGGTRGVLSLALLKQIVACVGKEAHETFDIICGTSTGGVIAALLGLEKASVVEAERLYDLLIREIFVRDSAAVTGARLVLRQAVYDERGWEGILDKAWGDRRMIDFAADPCCPKVFCISTVASSNPTNVMVWRNYNFPVNLVEQSTSPRARRDAGNPEEEVGAAAEKRTRAANDEGDAERNEGLFRAFFDGWRSREAAHGRATEEASDARAPSSSSRRLEDARQAYETRRPEPPTRALSPRSALQRIVRFFLPCSKAGGPRRPSPSSPAAASEAAAGGSATASPTSFLLVPSRGSRHAGSCRILVKDALRATTAAPGFFSGICWESQAFSDGALLANNPTAIALAEARGLYGEDVPIELVVSIGTGKFPSSFSSSRRGDNMLHVEAQGAAKTRAHSTSGLPQDASAGASQFMQTEKEETPAGGVSSLLGIGGWETLLAQLANCATNTEAIHDLLSDMLPPSIYFRFNPDISGNWTIDETRPERLSALKCLAERFFLDDEENRRKLVELVTRIKRDDEEDRELAQREAGERSPAAAKERPGEEEEGAGAKRCQADSAALDAEEDEEWTDLGGFQSERAAWREQEERPNARAAGPGGVWDSLVYSFLSAGPQPESVGDGEPRRAPAVLQGRRPRSQQDAGVEEERDPRDKTQQETRDEPWALERDAEGGGRQHPPQRPTSPSGDLGPSIEPTKPNRDAAAFLGPSPAVTTASLPGPSLSPAHAASASAASPTSAAWPSSHSRPRRSLWTWLTSGRGAEDAAAAAGASPFGARAASDGAHLSFTEKVLSVLSAPAEHQELHRRALLSARESRRLHARSPPACALTPCASGSGSPLPNARAPSVRGEEGEEAQGPAAEGGDCSGELEGADEPAAEDDARDEGDEDLVPPTGVQVVLQTIHAHLEEEARAAEREREDRKRARVSASRQADKLEATARSAQLEKDQISHLLQEQAMIHEAAAENQRRPRWALSAPQGPDGEAEASGGESD
ncbi:hypothetical protein BESB_009970 [Besnoitia besnoiti]|uniref:PNPLA domain-containing protein n=1 Tax=Besnoitia besnoiti TaxID=94643 RepID=A0A2A9MKX0_BESBE|nr:hypothetical protein BESB_009970 [Besnoitia besnoiti]PFH38655.1 hypothetical protein BESB_009970 [Besnoitia besnoiti]